MCAGHVIECGPQATGGNFSGFRAIPDLVEPGFPIAEIAADGSSLITKNPGTGGAVTTDTVTAQLVYEIGEPAYLNPDVITHLDTAQLTDLGEDRVEIRGVRGSAPPATTKVAITGVGGWENSVIFALTGTRPRREGRPRRAIRPPLTPRPSTGSTRSRSTGSGRRSTIPTARTPEPSCSRSRCREPRRPLGAPSPSRMVELALSSYPGLYALGPPQPGSAFGVYWPALLDQAVLEHVVHHHDGTTETIAPGQPTRQRARGRARRPNRSRTVRRHGRPTNSSSPRSARSCTPAPATRAATRTSASGYATGAAWEWLRSTLTVDELRRLLPETRDLAISRYELPNLGAVNFVLHGLLGSGATSSLRLDAQAKALGEWLRARSTKVPRSLVEAAPIDAPAVRR